MPSTEESGSTANSASAKAGKASKEKDAKVAGKSKEKEKEREERDRKERDRKKETKETKESVNGKEGTKDARSKDKVKEKEVVREKAKEKDKDKSDKPKAREREETKEAKAKDVKESKEKDRKRDKRSQEEEEEEEPRKRDGSNRRTKERSRKRRDPSSASQDSRSRDRRKRREKERYRERDRERDRDRARDRDREHDRDRSRSRDAGPSRTAKDVKAPASTPSAATAPARPAPPAKTAADLAQEKAEFEAFCQAQAAMAERASAPAPANDPLSGSMVLALGNFGGRAAGQGAPGQNDQISLFCRASGVDQRAEISLRGLPVHLAAEIMAQGPILGVNSSAVLMARIHKAEQMSRTRNLSLGNTAAVQAAHASGDLVTAFIAQYGVDASAEGALRALPMEAQRQVIGEGPLRGLNASALLMSRIRRVQGSLSAAAHPMRHGGMNPHLSGKIAL